MPPKPKSSLCICVYMYMRVCVPKKRKPPIEHNQRVFNLLLKIKHPTQQTKSPIIHSPYCRETKTSLACVYIAWKIASLSLFWIVCVLSRQRRWRAATLLVIEENPIVRACLCMVLDHMRFTGLGNYKYKGSALMHVLTLFIRSCITKLCFI